MILPRLLILALLVSACADPSAPVDRGDAGRYQLRTVGGHRLPVASNLGFYYWGGSVELRPDSTFVDVLTLGDRDRATTVDSVFGTYRLEGDSLRMTPTNWNHKWAVRRVGDRVSARWAEGIFLYHRQ